MSTSDEHLDDAAISAWLDGEIDKDGDAAMTKLAASNEAFAARAQRLRHLDELVRSAVPADEAIPAALLERLGLADVAEAPKVVSLAEAREARARAAQGGSVLPGTSRFWRIAAQVAIVAGLGLGLAVWNGPARSPQDQAAYRTLSNASAPSAVRTNGIVVFAPGIGADKARAIAATAGARLVGEPNAAGAWKLSAASGRRDAVLAALRADKSVVMAEAVDGEQP